jgi:rRNA-processing protein FCF1
VLVPSPSNRSFNCLLLGSLLLWWLSGVKVLLDTNALMVPEQFGVDIFSELERLGYNDFVVPSAVLGELKSLAKYADKGRDRVAANVGLQLAKRCEILDTTGDADLVLEKLAIKQDIAVFTNDKLLKKRLSIKGVTVIHLRQRRYLEVAMQKEF